VTRQYASTLRAEQQEQTRVRLLEAVRDELEHVLPDQLSFAAVAARAKVSERTVYRHFETKEAMMDAFWTWYIAGPFGVPTDDAVPLEQLPQYTRELYAAYERNEGVSRALVRSQLGRDVRDRSRSRRRNMFETSLGPVLSKLDADQKRRVVAVFQMLHSINTWHTLRERKLSGTEAADMAAWVGSVLIAELRANPKTLERSR
jgi:AcrR family transcriptional regulator